MVAKVDMTYRKAYHCSRGIYDSGGSCTMVGEVDMTQGKAVTL